MLTLRTAAIFADRLASCDNGRALHNGITVADLIAAEQAWQDDYEGTYGSAIAAAARLSGHPAANVRRMLLLLGGPGCLSGSMEYCVTCDLLERYGIEEANLLFPWDREALAGWVSHVG